MEDFEKIKENARSLPPGTTRGELICVEQTRYGKFLYYYDDEDKSYWYQSERTEKIHQEIMQKVKERRKWRQEFYRAGKRDSA